MCFGNENLETKMKNSFWIKKIRNIKFRSGKKNPEHIFQKFFLRIVSSFPLELGGAGSNFQERIIIKSMGPMDQTGNYNTV